MKTKPTSLRFDEDDLLLAKNKSGIKKTQKLMDFLLYEYVREFKPKFIPLPEDYVAFDKVAAIRHDGAKIKNVTKPERDLKPQEPLKTIQPDNATLKEGNAKIEAEIAQLEKELKSPPQNPLIGMKAWRAVRQQKIQELKNQLSND